MTRATIGGIGTGADVPTLPHEVRDTLRQLGLPIRLFGENLANVRDRLKLEVGRRQLMSGTIGWLKPDTIEAEDDGEDGDEEEEVTKYTQASSKLIEARQQIALFSMKRASERLERERRLKEQALNKKRKRIPAVWIPDNDDEKAGDTQEQEMVEEGELTRLDDACVHVYRSLRRIGLAGSQYVDSRAVSCITSGQVAGIPLIATGGWTGSIHLWDGASTSLSPIGHKALCHEDRIMGIAMQVCPGRDDDPSSVLIATTSLDMTAKIWKVQQNDFMMTDETNIETREGQARTEMPAMFHISEQTNLTGHAARLCRVAFHPLRKHVATTSFDHTWRLWDVETGENLLLQDGHWKECYGIGFHPDGNLASTTDFAGVVHVWDLRTGKSIKHFIGHAKRVLNTEFHPNGFQLATSGDDGTIRIWDLRKRKESVCIPAHSNLVTQLQFDQTGEYLASTSFDRTVKLWKCRDWNLLKQLRGHEGIVSGVTILDNNSIVTSAFDKTIKLWK